MSNDYYDYDFEPVALPVDDLNETQISESKADPWETEGKKMGRPAVWPFMNMDVGEVLTYENKADFARIRGSVSNARKLKGYSIKTKSTIDGKLLVKRIS